jgi:hypothetical protein
MVDHLVDGGNIRDVLYVLVLGGFLAPLAWSVSGCSPQQSAQLYPLIGERSGQ